MVKRSFRWCGWMVWCWAGLPAADAQQPAAPPPPPAPAETEPLFQPGVLLQAWFWADHAADTTTTFRIRRAELRANGTLVAHRIRYGMMIDVAKVLEFKDQTLLVADPQTSSQDDDDPASITVKQPAGEVSVLQDVYLSFEMPYVDITVGQFKIPVSWEGYNSSGKLLFAERSPVSRELGEKRDLGLRLSHVFAYFGYAVGIFNGATLNRLDTDNAKDLALRVEVYPVPGLMLAGAAYLSLWQRNAATANDRYEADLRFQWKSLLLQAEYIRARNGQASGPAIRSQGFYAAFAYQFLDQLEPCVRFGYLDPDIDRDLDPAVSGGKDELWHFDVGLNWYILKQQAKLQLNYVRYQFDNRTARDEFILAAQIFY